MHARGFGAARVAVPVIGQGTWRIDGADRASAIRALRAGIDSGMTHIDTAEMYGDAEIVVAGGMENMSAAPFAIPAARWGARMGDKKLVDTMIKDGLWDAYNNYHMGTTAENICDIWGITREELDEFGYNSQKKAADAIEAVPHTLPALWRAEKTAHKAAKAGFRWDSALGALGKLEEEIRELADQDVEKMEDFSL